MHPVIPVRPWLELLRSGKDGRRDIVLASHNDARAVFDLWRAEVTAAFGPPRDLKFAGSDNDGLEWIIGRAGGGAGVRQVCIRAGVQGTLASVLVVVQPAKAAHAPNLKKR